jgi:hypothetical protein
VAKYISTCRPTSRSDYSSNLIQLICFELRPKDFTHTFAIKRAYYLTDVSEHESGMTMFSPGSHLLKKLLTISKRSINPTNSLELRLHPGDAVFLKIERGMQEV